MDRSRDVGVAGLGQSAPESSQPTKPFSPNLLGAFVLSMSTCLILLSLASSAAPPLGLYEPNIYGSVPALAWVVAFLAMVLPIVVFALTIGFGFSSESLTRWLVISFVFAEVGFLFIPWMRYPIGYDRWDSWYHLGEVKAILAGAHTSASNFYPALHILLSITSEFTGASPPSLFKIFPSLVSFFILCGTYVACKWMGIGYKGSFVGVLAVSSLLGLPTITPLSFSIPFLMMIIALFLKPLRGANQVVLLSVVFSALVVTHFLTAVACLIGLIAMVILKRSTSRSPWFTIALFAIITSAWIFLFTQVYESPLRLIEEIVATGTFRGHGYGEILAGVGLTGLSAVLVVVAILFSRLVMLAMSAPADKTALLAVYRRFPSTEASLGTWAVSNILVFAGFGSVFGSGVLGDVFDRFVIYGLYAVVFLSAISFQRVLLSKRRRGIATVLVFGVLIVAGQVAFFYPAPATGRYNWEAGSTDMSGLVWIGRYVEPGSSFTGSTYNHAILSGLIGVDNATKLGLAFGMKLPKDLGCPPHASSSASFMIVTNFDLYVFARRGEINSSDLDCTIASNRYNQVYDNGAFWILSQPGP